MKKAGEDKKGKSVETEWSSVKNGSVRKKTAGRAEKNRCGAEIRDILKSAVIKQDEKIVVCFIRYREPDGCSLCDARQKLHGDALQYGRQVADIAAEHRRNKKDFTGKVMVSICPDF